MCAKSRSQDTENDRPKRHKMPKSPVFSRKNRLEPISRRFRYWRSERDLNPRAHFGTPTPLAGEPLRPLGYHSESQDIHLRLGYSSTRGMVCQEEKY